MPPGDPALPRRPGLLDAPFTVLALVFTGVLSIWISGCGSDKKTNPPAPQGVDLIVVTVGATNPLPLVKPGDRVDLPHWVVENAGDTPSGAFSIGFYLSSDDQFTTADALVDTLSCPGLAAGNDFQLPDSVTIPPIASGAYYLGVLLDRNEDVQESNGANNTRSVPVDVTLLPDLLVSLVPVPHPNFAPPGGMVSLDAWAIRNRGPSASTPCEYGYYLSTDEGIDTLDFYLGGGSVPSIATNGIWSIDPTNVTIPAGTSHGDYFLGVLVDRNEAVSEFSETNNNASVAFQVKELADLVIESDLITATPTTVSAGALVGISAGTIQNVGEPLPTLTSFQNGFYLSTNPVITPFDLFLGSAVGPPVYIGQILWGYDPYQWEATSVRIPADTSPGSFYIGVLIDRGNAISESNETNNYISTPITVQP